MQSRAAILTVKTKSLILPNTLYFFFSFQNAMKGINMAVRLLLFFDGLFEVAGEYVLGALERNWVFFVPRNMFRA